jgi:hypothetical protein
MDTPPSSQSVSTMLGAVNINAPRQKADPSERVFWDVQ